MFEFGSGLMILITFFFFFFNMVHPVVLYKIYESISVSKHNNLSSE
jgi:hypothetical protein